MMNSINSRSFNSIDSVNTENIKSTEKKSEISSQSEVSIKGNDESSYNKMDIDFKANYYKTMLTQTSLTSSDKTSNKQSKTENQTNKASQNSATKEVNNNNSTANKYVPVTMEQMDKMIPGFSKRGNSEQVLDALNYTMERCECNSPERKAMFLAQTGVESGNFTVYSEMGDSKYFLTGVSTRKDIEINANGNITINDKEANNIHRGYLKKDLGNKDVADVIRFSGRGFIQITGRNNFTNFDNWVGKNIKQDPKLKSEIESRIEKEVKDNPQAFIKAVDKQINNVDDSIVMLNETYVVKVNGKAEYVPGINTLERKIKGYEQSIEKLKQIPEPTPGQKKAIEDLTANQEKLKTQLSQTKGQQEKLKQDCIALQKFRDGVEKGDFKVDLEKADFTQEPYSFLIGSSPTLASTTTEYYWKNNNLNKYADSEDVAGATKVINGGAKALDERKENFDKALKTLK